MRQVNLSVVKREKTGKECAKKLRKQGLIPAIVYGHNFDPVPISVKANELESILHKYKGETLLFNLEVQNGETQRIQAILKDYQLHPVTDKIIHLDFVAIKEGETVSIDVPLEFVGRPVGLTKGGVIEIFMHDLTVECLPSNIPDKIQVDISNLDLGDVLHVKDIKVPEGVKVLDDPEDTVITIVAEGGEEEGTSTEESE
ncbi:MAG: 50S ribosomal protein L25 [Thermodesulfobacterium sp. 37_54]|jgi:large subunit ribosomal protein L25|uniref:Large ribosomal subunit protein bL25 n=1 Tax=Thermodesulfobacterium commune TaxID=1741 RepID=A0A101FJW3_9BACT|nr:MAG: 50S ribosomal protein L25 [Thermodesulfobacterium sp. 37_54]KUK19193.1 MAG: 50S ribosomal protein L25 [Thermodesulfobacterium commune]KUK38371.1 MAG: 50S ribosomal protein L25 [Thermodesulfobacterium commune]HAA83345.1 50S ribosomal protein L25 [Thermodesulfobacterium commune]HBT04328.1 50S ribosomal protein L25 [Thermodesulfobacterium commune]